MNKNPLESDYKPFPSPYPEPPVLPCEAELSEGATQPPTDRPPPADPPPDLINVSPADPLRSDNEEDDDEDPFAPFCADESDVDESPGKVASHECESVWMTVTRQASLCPGSKQLTIGIEEFSHQRLVLYGLKFNKIGISIKADLNDGHPISKAILFVHAEKYINSHQLRPHRSNIQRHKAEGLGIYYRGDFIISRRECSRSEQLQPRPVVASKNTTPFSRLLPPSVDAAVSDMESAWKSYYGKSDIIWHHRSKDSVVSEVNVTAPLLLAILHRSSFVSIRYDHYTTLQHLNAIPCHECAPNNEYVLRTMACLTQLHLDICDTLERVKIKDHNVFERSMDEMYTDMSKYLVYHCDEKDELPCKYIELPHFVVIKLHHGDKMIPLAMLYQQVPPYYFGIPVSLRKQDISTPIEYQELIQSSGEYEEISRYFTVIIEKIYEKLSSELETFFTYRSDLRGNDYLLQVYPYRFDQNNIPDCSCRYLAITIYDHTQSGGNIGE